MRMRLATYLAWGIGLLIVLFAAAFAYLQNYGGGL